MMKEKSTIALVDDERNILTSLGMALEAEGYKVRTYSDGASALGHSVRLRRHQRARRGPPRRNGHEAVDQTGQQAAAGRSRVPGGPHPRDAPGGVTRNALG